MEQNSSTVENIQKAIKSAAKWAINEQNVRTGVKFDNTIEKLDPINNEDAAVNTKVYTSWSKEFLAKFYEIQNSDTPIVFPKIGKDKSPTFQQCLQQHAQKNSITQDLKDAWIQGGGSEVEFNKLLKTECLTAFNNVVHYCEPSLYYRHTGFKNQKDEFQGVTDPEQRIKVPIISAAGFEFRGYTNQNLITPDSTQYKEIASKAAEMFTNMLGAAEANKVEALTMIPIGMGVFISHRGDKDAISAAIRVGMQNALDSWKGENPKHIIQCKPLLNLISSSSTIKIHDSTSKDALTIAQYLNQNGVKTAVANAADHDWMLLFDKTKNPGQCTNFGQSQTLKHKSATTHATSDEYYAGMTNFEHFSVQNALQQKADFITSTTAASAEKPVTVKIYLNAEDKKKYQDIIRQYKSSGDKGNDQIFGTLLRQALAELVKKDTKQQTPENLAVELFKTKKDFICAETAGSNYDKDWEYMRNLCPVFEDVTLYGNGNAAIGQFDQKNIFNTKVTVVAGNGILTAKQAFDAPISRDQVVNNNDYVQLFKERVRASFENAKEFLNKNSNKKVKIVILPIGGQTWLGTLPSAQYGKKVMQALNELYTEYGFTEDNCDLFFHYNTNPSTGKNSKVNFVNGYDLISKEDNEKYGNIIIEWASDCLGVIGNDIVGGNDATGEKFVKYINLLPKLYKSDEGYMKQPSNKSMNDTLKARQLPITKNIADEFNPYNTNNTHRKGATLRDDVKFEVKVGKEKNVAEKINKEKSNPPIIPATKLVTENNNCKYIFDQSKENEIVIRFSDYGTCQEMFKQLVNDFHLRCYYDKDTASNNVIYIAPSTNSLVQANARFQMDENADTERIYGTEIGEDGKLTISFENNAKAQEFNTLFGLDNEVSITNPTTGEQNKHNVCFNNIQQTKQNVKQMAIKKQEAADFPNALNVFNDYKDKYWFTCSMGSRQALEVKNNILHTYTGFLLRGPRQAFTVIPVSGEDNKFFIISSYTDLDFNQNQVSVDQITYNPTDKTFTIDDPARAKEVQYNVQEIINQINNIIQNKDLLSTEAGVGFFSATEESKFAQDDDVIGDNFKSLRAQIKTQINAITAGNLTTEEYKLKILNALNGKSIDKSTSNNGKEVKDRTKEIPKTTQNITLEAIKRVSEEFNDHTLEAKKDQRHNDINWDIYCNSQTAGKINIVSANLKNVTNESNSDTTKLQTMIDGVITYVTNTDVNTKNIDQVKVKANALLDALGEYSAQNPKLNGKDAGFSAWQGDEKFRKILVAKLTEKNVKPNMIMESMDTDKLVLTDSLMRELAQISAAIQRAGYGRFDTANGRHYKQKVGARSWRIGLLLKQLADKNKGASIA